ncbi:unnamed protein product [Urochloa humidicola]
MHMYGYGFPGQSFYCLKLPDQPKQATTDHVGLLTIESGEANVERIEEELKHMIDDKWQWKVKRISNTEYLATFPNKQILDAFSKSKGVTFARYNIVAKLSHSNMDPTASSVLQTGWVQIFNIPPRACNVDAVTLIAELAGEVIAVDEVSLIKEGPARVKLRARDVLNIRGYIEVFVDGVGYDFRFVAEQDKGQAQSKGPPPPPPKRRQEEESEEEGENSPGADWKRTRKGGGKASKEGNTSGSRSEYGSGEFRQCQELSNNPAPVDKQTDQNQGPEGGEKTHLITEHSEQKQGTTKQQASNSGKESKKGQGDMFIVDATPIRMHNPSTKQTFLITDHTYSAGTGSPQTHKEEGSKPREESKRPQSESGRNSKEPDSALTNYRCSQESVGMGDYEISVEEEMEGMEAQEEVAEEGDLQAEINTEEWKKSAGFKVGKHKRKFYPTVAARKSARGSQASPMKSKGNTDMPNPFSVLNSCSNEILEEIALNCDVVLGTNKEEITEALSAMRLEEQARAALAEANYKRHLADKLADLHVLEGENMELQVVTNRDRGVEGSSAKDNDNNGGCSRNDEEASTSQDKVEEQQKKKGGKRSGKGEERGSKLSRELRRISYQ